ncbi:hypothetical protein [Hahella sp. HN01]|uniref:hypothetical protein n=1 Tax=Hahella sp. HN01 TaxID=2847262 RepID=UPI001C1EE98F|nr:hypothetical protein [Hahella sp. HN01]MBU6955864.1 hypothetical protein [Hahella sp. HN01]
MAQRLLFWVDGNEVCAIEAQILQNFDINCALIVGKTAAKGEYSGKEWGQVKKTAPQEGPDGAV